MFPFALLIFATLSEHVSPLESHLILVNAHHKPDIVFFASVAVADGTSWNFDLGNNGN